LESGQETKDNLVYANGNCRSKSWHFSNLVQEQFTTEIPVKTSIFALLGLLIAFNAAKANHGGVDSFGSFRGGGFANDFRGIGGFGGFGGDFGFGFFDAERAQDRFADQFDTLQTKYNDGVANDADFLTSTAYDRIVSRTERLDDTYGLFVSSVERSIDRITDLIGTTNDDITYFNGLLADYQADTSLSTTRLDRIEAWITRITDRLNARVDSLTGKQSTLQTNLPSYQTFQTTIDSFLTDILGAGTGSTTGTTSSALSLVSSKLVSDAVSAEMSGCTSSSSGLTATATPEPTTAMLLVLASAAGCILLPRRLRRHVGG
jgi:hypothetical protein